MASWNPALRPNTESDFIPENKLASTSPPPPTVQSSNSQLPPVLSELQSHLPREPVSSNVFDPHVDDGRSADFFFSQQPVSSHTPQSSAQPEKGQSVSPDPIEAAVASEETLDSEESDTDSDLDDEVKVSVTESYSHQGETTQLEEALQEDAHAPLLNGESSGELDWGATDVDFDLGSHQITPGAAVLTEASVQEPIDLLETTDAPANIDWGTAADEEFNFGAAASDDVPSGGHQDEGAAKQEDLDALWAAALDDDLLEGVPGNQADFFVDDGEGFLEDDDIAAATPQQETPAPGKRYAPTATDSPAANRPQLAPMQPTSSYAAYGSYSQPTPQPTVAPARSESFVAKDKAGYSSPYDLPDDLSRPRRRAAHPVVASPTFQQGVAPPRTNSMYAGDGGPVRAPPPSNALSNNLSPPSSSHSAQAPSLAKSSQTTSKPASNGFFAELPMAPKARGPPSGRFTPVNSMYAPPTPPPPQGPPQGPPQQPLSGGPPLQRAPEITETSAMHQLQQPQRLDPFPDAPNVPQRTNSLPVPPSSQYSQVSSAIPAASGRYSPAPPSAPQAPPSNQRYSPAPPPVAAPAASARYSPAPPPSAGHSPTHNRYTSEPVGSSRPPVLPFAPRTSSPLVHQTSFDQHGQPMNEASDHSHPSWQSHQTIQSVEGIPRVPYKQPLEGVSEVDETISSAPTQPFAQHAPLAAQEKPATPPPSSLPMSGPPSSVSSPQKRTNSYTPQYQSVVTPANQASTPPISQYQPTPAALPTMEPQYPFGQLPNIVPASSQKRNFLPHRRDVSRDLHFLKPADDQSVDSLERWKGAPIFSWGVGGTAITCFPKQVPRYGTGHAIPMIKCSPGEIKVQSLKEILPLEETIAKFPGPLKAKNKKKEVAAWLGTKIDALERDFNTTDVNSPLSPEHRKRLEESILLWRVVRVLVGQDGRLEGTPAAMDAVKLALIPTGQESEITPMFPSQSSESLTQSEPVNLSALAEMRSFLAKGEREKAIWLAVDKRLWSHAILISSTIGGDVRKQVVQEFVRHEVKKLGGAGQSLAVLYEIFGGNFDESIDELVPASARAGFQMVSKNSNVASAKNNLEGLDQWRESLLLILNNRTEGDSQALLALGRLLAGYGRIEAAHVCFLFARAFANFGGADDPQSDITLLGADHKQHEVEVSGYTDSILLTEVYEFSLLLAGAPVPVVPHIQGYKLAHGLILAEHGFRDEAQQYCSAISACIKSTTRSSPYYNGSLLAQIDHLTQRLSQTPKGPSSSSSWISKPSMDKVSGSLLSKFNSFVSGTDDHNTSSANSGPDTGPFARIPGSTPTISPSQSNADLYGAYRNGGPLQSSNVGNGNSRYAPLSSSAPRATFDPSVLAQYTPQTQSTYQPARASLESSARPSMESLDSAYRRTSEATHVPQMGSPYAPSLYSPVAAAQPAAENIVSPAATPSYGASPYQSLGPPDSTSATISYDAQPSTAEASSSYAPPVSSYEPPTSSYEPPNGGGGGYEPPSYQPYEEEASQDTPVEGKGKQKKSFMDEDGDDDMVQHASALKKKQREQADKEAEEAFKKAAEADAARDKQGAGEKRGWFGGWFKKEASMGGAAAANTPTIHKAKLGEENSFVYDPDLKKWINKKAGSSDTAAPTSATPPPPRAGPPMRSVSGMAMGSPPQGFNAAPMSAPPTRSPTSNPQRSVSMPPQMQAGPPSRTGTPVRSDSPGPGPGPDGDAPPALMRPPLIAGSGPPSRPSTALSASSSIDDLLGAPTARKGGARTKSRKGGRYIDVMAK